MFNKTPRFHIRITRIFIYLLPVTFLFFTLQAQSFSKVGTTTAQFLKLGVGARARGMGGSFTAVADDGSAHYWNPAGLALANEFSASFSHNDWALDIRNEFVSVTLPQGRYGVFGFSVTALMMDDKEVTTVREPDGTGIYYSVNDLSFGASYARRISDRLSFGMTAKYIRLSGYNEIGKTVAVDIGSILRTDFRGLRIGMALSNFGGEIKYEGMDLINKSDVDEDIDGNYPADVNLQTESWPLPLMIRIGISVDMLGGNDAFVHNNFNRLTMAIDAEHPNDSPEHLNLGLEYSFRDMFFLRSGYRLNYDEENISLGAGFRLNMGSLGKFAVDYAVMPLGPFGNTSHITVELFQK